MSIEKDLFGWEKKRNSKTRSLAKIRAKNQCRKSFPDSDLNTATVTINGSTYSAEEMIKAGIHMIRSSSVGRALDC